MRGERIVAPAIQALRTYWGTTVLLVAACAAGLAVMLPVASLVRWAHGAVELGLALPPVRGAEFGLLWGAFAQTATEVRQAAVGDLARLLLGVAAGVLAVTWFTTLSVSMARASGRATEIGVRRAVGASRRHLLAGALLEGTCIAFLALVVGGATGVAAARLSLGAWPGSAAPGGHAPGIIAAAATLGGLVLGALIPLLFARRPSRIAVVDPTPLGLVVPAVQLGLSLTVLVSASLLARGAARPTMTEHGGSASGQVFEVTGLDSPPAARAARLSALLRMVGGQSPVQMASLTAPGVLIGLGAVDNVVTNCGACRWGTEYLQFHPFFGTLYVVSADTFRALDLRVVEGRRFTDVDGWAASRVAVVSRSVATQHFEGGKAVGRSLLVGHGSLEWYRVVGVVDDRVPQGIGGPLEPREAVYLSVLQHPPSAVDLLVRGPLPPATAAAVDRAIRDTLGPRALVRRVSEASVLAAEAAPLRWFAGMFGFEGFGLLAIATIGTFAMMWLWVHSLLAELGVRRAVGAKRRHVMAYVLWRAVAVAAGGAAFGAWLGMMVWDALGAAVSGLPAWDPAAVLRYGFLLGAAALAGALLPAWRAAHASPTALLSS